MYAIVASGYATVAILIFTLVFLVTDQTPLHFRSVTVYAVKPQACRTTAQVICADLTVQLEAKC